MNQNPNKASILSGRASFLKLSVVALLVFPVSQVLQSIELFRKLEQRIINLELDFGPALDEVVIIQITREDYREIFGGQSPLAPNKLGELIRAVAFGRPRVIGVDIDTAEDEFLGFEQKLRGPIENDSGKEKAQFLSTVPIAWARRAAYSSENKRYFTEYVLGELTPKSQWGLAVLMEDSGDVVRRYSRFVRSDLDQDTGLTATFPVSILTSDSRVSARMLESDEPRLIRYRIGSPVRRISAGQVLAVYGGAGWWRDGPLRGKIVIIGGDYDTKDEHQTPLGALNGAELVARIIETELLGGGRVPSNPAVAYVVAAIAAILLHYFYSTFPTWSSFARGLMVLGVMSVISSIIATASFSRVPLFFFVLVLVFLNHLWKQRITLR